MELNVNDEDRKLDVARDEKCVPFARKILRMFVDRADDLVYGTANPDKEKIAKASGEVALQILKDAMDAGMTRDELQYAFAVALQPYDPITAAVENSLNQSYEKAVQMLFGADDYAGITLKMLDDALLGRRIGVNSTEDHGTNDNG